MKIVGHAAQVTGERSHRPNIPGRNTLRARPGSVHSKIPLSTGASPVIERALSRTQAAFSGPGFNVSLGIGDKPVQ
jgi:hypothetical protein